MELEEALAGVGSSGVSQGSNMVSTSSAGSGFHPVSRLSSIHHTTLGGNTETADREQHSRIGTGNMMRAPFAAEFAAEENGARAIRIVEQLQRIDPHVDDFAIVVATELLDRGL